MGEFVAQLYMGLAEIFAGLLPQSFRDSARTGPLWRRIVIALLVAICSLVIGLILAALFLTVTFFSGAVVLGIAKALLP